MKSHFDIKGALFFFFILLFAGCKSDTGYQVVKPIRVTCYEITDISLSASQDHKWYEFPVEAVFRHSATKTEIRIWGFYIDDNTWVLRFAPPLAGKWVYQTTSSDPGLANRVGTVQAVAPTAEQIKANPNYRGQVRISSNGRYFEYDDGTPFFLMADTGWAMNTSRAGLGENNDGPFYQYMADRKAKGFTALMMKHIRGTGDTDDPECQRNEGGYPFLGIETRIINPEYFKYLDIRMRELWANGFVLAMPAAWFGKRKCFLDLAWAKRLSSYLMVRYGAFNTLFAVGGEYQYTLNCNWDWDAYNELGNLVQAFNSYNKPVSLHPSGRVDWPEPHNVQSSSPYHHSPWLDNNWLQTGQWTPFLHYAVNRSLENYHLEPVKPVFLSEGYYERYSDPEHGYHSRWQPWSAFLNGSCGYGYGAWGMWQFHDPHDPYGETGLDVHSLPWWETLSFEGANQMKYVGRLLAAYKWWELIPSRELLLVDGLDNPLPSADDITPPHCASINGELYIIYIPRGNEEKKIEITGLDNKFYRVTWYNPRSGVRIDNRVIELVYSHWTIPGRPMPADEDWVLVIEKEG